MPIKTLLFDYETRSVLDLSEAGLSRYVRHPSTEILMMSWQILGEGDIRLWEPHLSSEPPSDFIAALQDPAVLKVAWNAQFEREITAHKLGIDIPIEQWRDPIVLARCLSLPGKLDKVGELLHLEHQKDPRGADYIEMFSYPVHKGGDQTLFGISEPRFRDWDSHPREWEAFKEYCVADCRSEAEAWVKLSAIPFPEDQWRGWFLDQKINRFGMPARRDRAEKALRLAQRFVLEQREKIKVITKLKNPNSDPQMLAWVRDRGYPLTSLNAKYVKNELDNPASALTSEAKEALRLRASARKSSYTKLERLISLLGDNNRLTYEFVYMGAARTGRWKSGGKDESSVQVQNLSRGEEVVKKKLERALELIDAEDYEALGKEFVNPKTNTPLTVVEVVISLLRSMFEAPEGKKFVISDKSAIETRLVAWESGCSSLSDVFNHPPSEGGDPYLAFATKLYSKSYADLWHEYHDLGKKEERQNSKPSVLGCVYELSGGELYVDSMGNELRGGLWGYAKYVCGVDMPKDLCHRAVKIFRDSYPEVVKFWEDLNEAFKQVLLRGGEIRVGEVTWNSQEKQWVTHPTEGKQCVLVFRRQKTSWGTYIISIELPSGRRLHYLNATLDREQKIGKKSGKPYAAEILRYDGIEHSNTQDADGKTQKKKFKWGRVKTSGGKICENVTQAIARDDLLESMFLAEAAGFHLWGLFHDELATEVDDDPWGLSVADLNYCMTRTPKWAPGLLLGAEGFETRVYKKD